MFAFDKLSRQLLIVLAVAWTLTGCERNQRQQQADIRPVRSMVVEKRKTGDAVMLTGQLRARDEVRLAFRLPGKLVARLVNVGDAVRAGQVIATLDSENEKNARNAAQADYVAALAVLEQAEVSERRVGDLLREKAVARAEYEGALRQLKTARAQVNAARAKLNSAQDQLGYTQLKAEADAVIIQKGAEPGEVVGAGQMILLMANKEGRDAVFDMPAQMIRDGLSAQQQVEVWLAESPEIKTTGTIREIAPQADAATRTYQVKVGLEDAPSGMFLGSTVVGRLILQADMGIHIPASALNMLSGNPSVWIVDAKEETVHARPVTVERYAQDSIVVASGLEEGMRIITAGVQALYEGQKVKLLEDTQ